MLGPAAAAAVSMWKGMMGNLMATAAMLAYFFWRNRYSPKICSGHGPQSCARESSPALSAVSSLPPGSWCLMLQAAIHSRPQRCSAPMIFNGSHSRKVRCALGGTGVGYTALHFFAFIDVRHRRVDHDGSVGI